MKFRYGAAACSCQAGERNYGPIRNRNRAIEIQDFGNRICKDMDEKEIVERIMSAHWDMKACDCWVCVHGRKAGCRPIAEYLPHNHGNRKKYLVPDSRKFGVDT